MLFYCSVKRRRRGKKSVEKPISDIIPVLEIPVPEKGPSPIRVERSPVPRNPSPIEKSPPPIPVSPVPGKSPVSRRNLSTISENFSPIGSKRSRSDSKGQSGWGDMSVSKMFNMVFFYRIT